MPNLSEAAKLYISEWNALEDSRIQVNDFFEEVQDMIAERLKEAWAANNTGKALYIWKDRSPVGRLVVGDLCENDQKCKIDVVILDPRRTGKNGEWAVDLYATNPFKKYTKNQDFRKAVEEVEKEHDFKLNMDDLKSLLLTPISVSEDESARMVDAVTEQATEHIQIVCELDSLIRETSK